MRKQTNNLKIRQFRNNSRVIYIILKKLDESDLSFDDDNFSDENESLNKRKSEKISLKSQYLENKGIRFCK